jgi:2-aminoadipate transaminase
MDYKFSNRAQKMTYSLLRANAKVRPGEKVISFALGYPPVEAFPVATLKQISDYLYNQVDPERFLQYGPTEGLPELRQLLKKHLITEGILAENDAPDNDVLITAGSTQGFDLANRIFCNEGDQVLFEEQTYRGAISSVVGYGAVPVAVKFDLAAESFDFAALEAKLKNDTQQRIKLIYVIPTFQNPLGTSMKATARKKLYDLAKKYQVMIFEDDPYGDLLYSGEKIPKIKALDRAGLVIYAGSFSKILAPGTRLGYVLANKKVLDKLILAKQISDSHTNFYWQNVVVEYVKHFNFADHVKKLIELYRLKLTSMETELDKIDQDKLTYFKPQGGFFICCKMSEKIDYELFYQKINELHVKLIPGNVMSVAGKGYNNYFRLNFTEPSLEKIRIGINLIGQALDLATIENETPVKQS